MPTLTVSLSDDSGSSATDLLTSDATLTGTATPEGVVTVTENGVTLAAVTADASGD